MAGVPEALDATVPKLSARSAFLAWWRKSKTFDRLQVSTARDGGGSPKSRCHRFEALGEIYNLRRVPEPDSAVSGGSRANNARGAPVHKNIKSVDGLQKDTAFDGSGLRRSRCHRFEALGEIYSLRRVPEPENFKKHSKIMKT